MNTRRLFYNGDGDIRLWVVFAVMVAAVAAVPPVLWLMVKYITWWMHL